MSLFPEIKEALLHFLFPHICSGCGSDIMTKDSSVCLRCLHSLPETGFPDHPGNPVEKKFWGRLPVAHAAAQYYFTKESLIQHLMHQFKYKGDRALGFQLGFLMGAGFRRSPHYDVDALIPLPLFRGREKRRGFNQAAILCEGMAASMKVPVLNKIIIRSTHTDTQTRKSRIQRWQNIEGKFELADQAAIRGKRLLLVDDVITTGATLEACGHELLKAEGVELSIAALCYASK